MNRLDCKASRELALWSNIEQLEGYYDYQRYPDR